MRGQLDENSEVKVNSEIVDSEVASQSTRSDPTDSSLTRLLCPWVFQARILEQAAMPLLQDETKSLQIPKAGQPLWRSLQMFLSRKQHMNGSELPKSVCLHLHPINRTRK